MMLEKRPPSIGVTPRQRDIITRFPEKLRETP